MKKAWIIVGSVVGAIVVAIVAWIVIDLCVTTNAEVAENLIYESFDEMEKEFEKMKKESEDKSADFKLYRDFITVEDVTQIGKDKDNAEYFLVTYRMNGAELNASVVKIEEKNGEPKGEFVNGGFDVKYMLR